ncbi:hypothetical protein, partial [Stenotrophomonas maltophilia group sp. Smal13]|uniref:hypothetical protein n=1 Tax=Stenotrophomonas maltophilia group sp. Smal13 TaxID=3377166 RepID=UPI00255497B7
GSCNRLSVLYFPFSETTPSCSIVTSGEAGHVLATVDHRHIQRCPEGPIASSDDDGRRWISHRHFRR